MSALRKLKRRAQVAKNEPLVHVHYRSEAWDAPLTAEELAFGEVLFGSDDGLADVAARAIRQALIAGMDIPAAFVIGHVAACETGGGLGRCAHTDAEISALLRAVGATVDPTVSYAKSWPRELLARAAAALENVTWSGTRGGWARRCTRGSRRRSNSGRAFVRSSSPRLASASRSSWSSINRRSTRASSRPSANPSTPFGALAAPSSVRRIHPFHLTWLLAFALLLTSCGGAVEVDQHTPAQTCDETRFLTYRFSAPTADPGGIECMTPDGRPSSELSTVWCCR